MFSRRCCFLVPLLLLPGAQSSRFAGIANSETATVAQDGGTPACDAGELSRTQGRRYKPVRAGEKWRHFSRCWPAPAAPAALA
jgi:hypothetical protein